jgi:hypothetical protein
VLIARASNLLLTVGLPESFEIERKLAVMADCEEVHGKWLLCSEVTVHAIKNQVVA